MYKDPPTNNGIKIRYQINKAVSSFYTQISQSQKCSLLLKDKQHISRINEKNTNNIKRGSFIFSYSQPKIKSMAKYYGHHKISKAQIVRSKFLQQDLFYYNLSSTFVQLQQ
ncbi:hypothetical protein ABPG72_012869 [Tetrahymena utriculariae]